jgi:ABC-type nitrate/sulfonate/bicarbonate transport system substrate-binding protein
MRRRDALGLTLAGIVAVPTATRAQTPVSVRVGAPPYEAAAEVYFARDQGYFTKAGLDVSIVPILNTSAIAEAVASGGVDVGFIVVF